MSQLISVQGGVDVEPGYISISPFLALSLNECPPSSSESPRGGRGTLRTLRNN